MAVRPRKISDIKPLLTNLAQTSHYEVQFGSLPRELKTYLSRKGIDTRFIAESAGLLCYSALLPTTNLASNSVSNYMGIRENFAHTRQYDEISLDFYVDSDYRMLKFLESWMEFIASGSFNHLGLSGETQVINQNSDAYFNRIQYPAYYKANAVKIIKFDRDYRKEVEYNFRGLYPRSISSIPVTYTNSDTLKVSASFLYDRYIAGKTNSFNQSIIGDANNADFNQSQSNPENPQTAEDIFRASQETYNFGVDTNNNIGMLTGQPIGSTSGEYVSPEIGQYPPGFGP